MHLQHAQPPHGGHRARRRAPPRPRGYIIDEPLITAPPGLRTSSPPSFPHTDEDNPSSNTPLPCRPVSCFATERVPGRWCEHLGVSVGGGLAHRLRGRPVSLPFRSLRSWSLPRVAHLLPEQPDPGAQSRALRYRAQRPPALRRRPESELPPSPELHGTGEQAGGSEVRTGVLRTLPNASPDLVSPLAMNLSATRARPPAPGSPGGAELPIPEIAP